MHLKAILLLLAASSFFFAECQDRDEASCKQQLDPATLLQLKTTKVDASDKRSKHEDFKSGNKRKPYLTEVVVAHFDEDLEWIKEFASPDFASPDVGFTVYSKGNPTQDDMQLLPNIGRESHTYLYHIVRNYDSLAPWTVFTQATKPGWGYKGHVRASGHLTDNFTFSDYLRPFPGGSDSLFIFSAALHYPLGLQSFRRGSVEEDYKNNTKSSCPLYGADDWTLWNNSEAGRRWYAESKKPSLTDFYHKYIALDENDGQPLTLAFAQGARFAVSKERIHSRPRQYYSDLLRQVERLSNPFEGFWMEASWYDVFYPDALQTKKLPCALPEVPSELDMSWAETSDANATQDEPCILNEFGEPAQPCDIETNSTLAVQKWISSNSTVLEIGASYGTVSCAIADAQNQSGLVVSVEPDPVVLRALEGNIVQRKCNVRVLKAVIGTTSVQVIKEGPGGYSTRTVPVGDHIAKFNLTTRAWPLDQVQEVYGMKFDTAVIDCEGCLPTMLAENPGLILQVNLFIIEAHNDEEDAAVQNLQTLGFELVEQVFRQHVLRRL